MSFYLRASTAVFAFASAGIFAVPANADEIRFMAELSGDAQVPPVMTEATGTAEITVDTQAMTVTWMLTHQGLSGEPLAAHFHGPTTPQENAPPVFDMGRGAYGATADVEASEEAEGAGGTGDEKTLAEEIMEGSAQLTDEQLGDLQAGRYYINIHTELHPDGEIRGQVVPGEFDIEARQEETEGQSGVLASSAAAADIAAGEKLFRSSCRSCHGPKAQGMASFPKLAGKDEPYLLERLHQYHAGDTVGPNSKLMIPVAVKLSDEDMANVAAYIASTFN